MVNLGGQSDDTPSTSLRDIYEVLYQQGYELSAEGDTNAELQAAPNLQRHLLPGIVNGSASEKSIYFQGQSKDFFATGTDDSTLVGNYLGDPAVIVYGSLGVRSLNSKNIFMAFQVTIEYDVEFLVMTELFHKYKHYIFEINLLRPRSVAKHPSWGAIRCTSWRVFLGLELGSIFRFLGIEM